MIILFPKLVKFIFPFLVILVLTFIKDNKLILEYKNKRDKCTLTLNKYRENIKTANCILEDIPKVKEVIKIEQQIKRTQEEVTKTNKKDRYAR